MEVFKGLVFYTKDAEIDFSVNFMTNCKSFNRCSSSAYLPYLSICWWRIELRQKNKVEGILAVFKYHWINGYQCFGSKYLYCKKKKGYYKNSQKESYMRCLAYWKVLTKKLPPQSWYLLGFFWEMHFCVWGYLLIRIIELYFQIIIIISRRISIHGLWVLLPVIQFYALLNSKL